MKKIICTLLVLIMSCPAFFVCAAEDAIKLSIDGKNVEFTDACPMIVDGRTLVPMRALAEALGAEVNWYEDSKTIVLEKTVQKLKSINFSGEKSYDSVVIKAIFTIDNPVVCVVNMNPSNEFDPMTKFTEEQYKSADIIRVAVDSNPTIYESRTYIPARYVANVLGYNVEWNADTKTVSCASLGTQDCTVGQNFDLWISRYSLISHLSVQMYNLAPDLFTDQYLQDMSDYYYNGLKTENTKFVNFVSMIAYKYMGEYGYYPALTSSTNLYASDGTTLLNGKTKEQIEAILLNDFKVNGFEKYMAYLRSPSDSDKELVEYYMKSFDSFNELFSKIKEANASNTTDSSSAASSSSATNSTSTTK
ncbi:MAG: copper amine oxidase N-terminal domain-containing protein [Bacillota bacterium]|nr:copper amine oxidase N-terminal domain-containing protein [Bacillota bacterium]